MKVYAVSKGQDDDYSIEALFSTHNLAKQYIDAMSFDGDDDFNNIETLEVNKHIEKPPKSMNVHGSFDGEDIVDVEFTKGDTLPWTVSVEQEFLVFNGTVAVKRGENIEQFRERVEEELIDRCTVSTLTLSLFCMEGFKESNGVTTEDNK